MKASVSLLMRDHGSGKPLYETRVATERNVRAEPATCGALFSAALVDFPRLVMNPRRLVV